MKKIKLEGVMIHLKGQIALNEKGIIDDKYIASARILNCLTGEVKLTDHEGNFTIKVDSALLERNDCLLILPPKDARVYSPRWIRLGDVEKPRNKTLSAQKDITTLVIPIGMTALSEVLSIPRIGSLPGVVPASVWALERWFQMSLLQKIVVVGLILPFALHTSLDFGLKIPSTDLDDEYREIVQRFHYIPTRRPVITFRSIRSVYYPGIRYSLSKGKYNSVTDAWIMDGASLSIEAGTEISFAQHKGLKVSGKLDAIGTRDDRIVFKGNDNRERWSNVTIEGGQSIGSQLINCVITGGGGLTSEGNNAVSYGGGLQLRDTIVNMESLTIENCQATKGGGLFIVNSDPVLGQKPLSGSVLRNLTIRNCVAVSGGGVIGGGGGMFVTNTFPEFHDCQFESNRTEGMSACGGGIYMGKKSRATFTSCLIKNNRSAAEGGGVYIYDTKRDNDLNLTGVSFIKCDFDNNESKGSGGALSASNSEVFIKNCNILNNKVEPYLYVRGSDAAKGGGVYIQVTDPEVGANLLNSGIENTTFTNNKVAVDTMMANQVTEGDFPWCGGALYVYSVKNAFENQQFKFKLRGNNFYSNSAPRGAHVMVSPFLKNAYLSHYGDTLFNNISFNGEVIKPLKLETISVNQNIITDTTYITQFEKRFSSLSEKPLRKIQWIIVGAARSQAGNVQAYIDKMKLDPTCRRLPHYLIERSGVIYSLVDCKEQVECLSKKINLENQADIDMDASAIVVELLCDTTGGPKDDQMQSFAKLVKNLRRTYEMKSYSLVGRGFLNYLAGENQGEFVQQTDSLINWGKLFELSFE